MTIYENKREYRKVFTEEDLEKIINGDTIAEGTGVYPELDEKPINWIAVKSSEGLSFSIYWGNEKKSHEYIRHNEEKITDMKLVQELLNCTKEVLKYYDKT